MNQATHLRISGKKPRTSRILQMGAVAAVAAAAGCGTTTTTVTTPPTTQTATTTETATATEPATSPTAGAATPTAGTGTPTPTGTAPGSPGGSAATFGDGTYTVGQTVKPGTYRAAGPGSLCYWERLKGFSGELDDVIANNTSGDPSVVTIAPTDKGFRTSGCGTWTSDLSQITKSKTSFGPGTYIVNTDIAPGTYSAPGGDTCYWARLSGFGGSFDEVIANDYATGSVRVTIAPGDKGFESSGCGTFTKG